MESIHKSVLLKETIEGLNLQDGAVVLDATFGGGGHSMEILKRFPKAKIVALDQDKGAWRENDPRISFHNENFSNLGNILKSEQVDGEIFDLGLSSDQLENSGRGFSFMKDEPLIMTMKENPSPEDLTAEEIVNSWDEENLADIIYGYGEERYARRIAKAIVGMRKEHEIKTTHELVKIIESAVPGSYKRGRINCATKTFQALRIAANDELGSLQKGLEGGFETLKVGGRMAVISFHSLEDRVVKKFFKEKVLAEDGKLINKKPIIAGEEELKENKRSRSAKLRIIEKIK